MFTYISIEEFADGVVKNNKYTNRKELIASLREALAAKKNGARCMICGAPIWAAGSGVTGTYLCFTCTTGEADDSEDYPDMGFPYLVKPYPARADAAIHRWCTRCR